MENQLINKVDHFVFQLFAEADTCNLLFHNYKHTHDMVMACQEIGSNSGLTEDELEMVIIAGWFHDVGYLQSNENHEELGVEVATKFLKEQNYPEEKIEIVASCIRATKMGAPTNNLLEDIMADADLKGLSSDDYAERSELLREECRMVSDPKLSQVEWLEKEVEFLTNHRYKTKYALLNFQEKKMKNILRRTNEISKLMNKLKNQEEKKSKAKADKTPKKNIPEKGIETMFRTALKNHIELSAIADNKANIMLSINALIISIIISNLFSKFDKHPELILPSTVMLLICLATMILATLSTRPKVTSGTFTLEDVKARKANLLFFGNFHKMVVDNYEWGMKEMMKDGDYLYGTMIRDLHSLGVVLAKKYQYLSWCYVVFMYGMVGSVLIYGISMYLELS